jgi:hypothetical protein
MHVTQHQGGLCPAPIGRVDGQPESDADVRLFELRESGYTGWIDQHGYPAGYFVTDWGLAALATTTTGTPDDEPADVNNAPGTAGQVLRDAALYVERYGWIQGAYYDATSQVFTPAACMVGAIAMVCYGGPVDAPAQHFDDPGYLDFEEAVLHLDRYLLVEDSSESYEFNDARGRTVEHVVYVLRQAASTPAHELIDAIRAIDARNEQMAALAETLVPSGAFADEPDGQPSRPVHVNCWCTDTIGGGAR